MTSTRELLFRLLMISVGVWFLGRFILPMLWNLFSEYFTGNKRSQSAKDIDMLIENKKQMMRATIGTGANSAVTQNTKKSSPTHQFYKDAFLEASKNKAKNLEALKTVLTLWDSLEWGASDLITKISQKISQSMGTRIESQELFDMIRFCDKRDLFLPPVGSEPLLIEQITSVLESFLFADIFLFGAKDQELARILKITTAQMEKVRLTVGSMLQGRDLDKAKLSALQGNDQWSYAPQEKEIILIKWVKNKKGFKTKAELLLELQSILEFFKTLMPLPELKNSKDYEGALVIFEADQNTPLEVIKKRYKKLAVERHPDKLISKGIPSEFEKIATENFAQIQLAYNIIQQNKK